ncbi:MAG: hypothetical protein M3Z28_06260 [Candidatus Dormibacteraeota bacterium]|nr:hypothetical protein [Candidatus Dormibacteraeota bacterium]
MKVANPTRSTPLSAEVKALIGRISRENRLWETKRIQGELLKLGIIVSYQVCWPAQSN